MALTRSFPTQHPSGLSITDTRRVTAARYARNADGTPRAGILPSHPNPLVTGRASMGYDIAPFNAVTARMNTGAEEIANDAVTTVSTTAAPGTNSRIDVIYVRAQFMQHGDTNNDVVFGVVQGNPAASPIKPVVPAGALELATATILSTTTTTATVVITQTHPFTAAAGGVVWLRNQLEQDAWSPANGAVAYRLDTGAALYRVGSTWRISYEDTGWAALPLVPSWVNFGGGTYADAQYRRVNGVVHVRGLIKGGTTVAGQTVANLPGGFRPVRQSFKSVAVAGGVGQVEVAADGRIIHSSMSTTWTALEFSFPAEQ